VRFAATPERLFRCAGPGWGQRFPNVTEEDDPLEVPFQKIEEGEETIVVVPEHVASIARAEVEVGYDCDLHLFSDHTYCQIERIGQAHAIELTQMLRAPFASVTVTRVHTDVSSNQRTRHEALG
jgi:hypothetical protein